MADGGVWADGDAVYAVAIDIIGEGGVVAHGQVPGAPDFGLWVDAGFVGDIGSEEAEEKCSPAEERAGRVAEDGGLGDGPEESHDAVFE